MFERTLVWHMGRIKHVRYFVSLTVAKMSIWNAYETGAGVPTLFHPVATLACQG